jgi:DNA polymerase III sliding clamp (beta) subunit (PCNA family)
MAVNFNPKLTQVGIRNQKVTAADSVWFQEVDLGEGKNLDFSIPGSVLPELVALLSSSSEESVEVGLSDNGSMMFQVGSEIMTSKAKVVQFPDLDKTFLQPAMSNKEILSVNRNALRAAVSRIRITSDSSTNAVIFDLLLNDFDKIHVSAKDKKGSYSQEAVAAKWTGKDRKIVFHHQYLSNMLDAFDADLLEFKFGPDQPNKPSPVLVQANGRSGVLNQLRADLVC